jgi:hypothetical protein
MTRGPGLAMTAAVETGRLCIMYMPIMSRPTTTRRTRKAPTEAWASYAHAGDPTQSSGCEGWGKKGPQARAAVNSLLTAPRSTLTAHGSDAAQSSIVVGCHCSMTGPELKPRTPDKAAMC